MEKSNAGKQSLALKIFALSLFCLMFLFMLLGCASPDGNFGADSNGQIMISLPTERGDSFSEINERGFKNGGLRLVGVFALNFSLVVFLYAQSCERGAASVCRFGENRRIYKLFRL